MKRDSSTSRVRVCLLFRHPLVLTEIRRILSDEPFELFPLRIDPPLPASLESLLSPETLLHVIDSDALGPQTAALVTAVLAANPSARPVVLGDDFGEATAFSLLRLGTKGIVTYAEVPEQTFSTP